MKIKIVLSFIIALNTSFAQAGLFGDDDEQGATPDTLTTGEISPAPIEVIPQGPLMATEPWKQPNYSNQTGALGYNPKTFDVPEGLRARVDFWKDIYARYTTNQGVMHDSLHIEIVYRPVDFNHIMRNESLNSRQKHHARERLVNEYRKEIESRLLRLAKLSSSSGLEGEDLRVWKLFEKINDENKFEAAAKRGRVRFQLGQKDRFALGIYYSGRYIREMEKIFREEGLPIELTRLPFVESSFNIYARSRVGASGIWQFMRRTARPYMMVNTAVDERNDPIKATRSAARLLRSNYMMLQSWPLALTGYNHGPSGIARIVKKTGTTDLVQIINNYSSKRFGFASENFYACFLAAIEVEKNANRYFGNVKWSAPLEHAEIKLTKPVSFEAAKAWFKGDADLAHLYNPHFTTLVQKGRMNMPRGTVVRVPIAMKEIALKFVSSNQKLAETEKEADKVPAKLLALPIAPAITTIQAAATPLPLPVTTPKPSTTPVEVADAPESINSPETIVAAMPSVSPTIAPAEAQTATVTETPTETETETETATVTETGTEPYIVKSGDSFIGIAKKFKIPIPNLKEANPGIRTDLIKVGQTILLPVVKSSAQ